MALRALAVHGVIRADVFTGVNFALYHRGIATAEQANLSRDGKRNYRLTAKGKAMAALLPPAGVRPS